MVRRRVFSAPPSQKPVVVGGKVMAQADQEIEALKNQLMSLQMATGQASMMEAQLLAEFPQPPAYPGASLQQGGGGGPAGPGSDPGRKTPWYPSGAPFPTTLSQEILAFTQLVSLDQQERDQRDALILSVAYAAIQVWPSSRLAVDGCYATGTSEPSAPLSLVISNCKRLSPVDIEHLAASIQGHAKQTSFDETQGREGMFQVVSSNGIVLKAMIYEGRDPGKARRQALMSALNEVPHSRTLAVLLRHILYHACASMVGSEPGQLPHEALLCMSIFACRRTGDLDPGNALLLFLNQLGRELDLVYNAISIAGYAAPKPCPSEDLIVLAPENPAASMTAECRTWRQIRAHLQSFSAALRSYNPATVLTPLSTIIAHRPLWRRVNGQQAKLLSGQNSLAGTPEGALSPEAMPSQQMSPAVAVASVAANLSGAASGRFLNGVSPSTYSTSTQGMTPESPLLTLPDSTLLEIARTQSLNFPKSTGMISLEHTDSNIAQLAAKFPNHVAAAHHRMSLDAQSQSPVSAQPLATRMDGSPSTLAALAMQFPEVVTPPGSVLSSPAIEDLASRFPLSVAC
ncbi:hypothetical protein DIPPA_11757 [Diplonema papillatum]|nr:hypothetical protein DIPPA_11757 [Diplonema papillatum]